MDQQREQVSMCALIANEPMPVVGAIESATSTPRRRHSSPWNCCMHGETTAQKADGKTGTGRGLTSLRAAVPLVMDAR